MAYIDKMHFDKKDIPGFYEYLKSIDEDFKKFFPNASSILDYTYYWSQYNEEQLSKWEYDEDLPVSNFPHIVNTWLAHRADLPELIRKELLAQYGEKIFTEPIYKEPEEEISHRFKVTAWAKYRGRKMTKPIQFWSHSPTGGAWRWYPELRRFVRDEYVTPDLLGRDFYWGSSCYNFKSIKAIFRHLKKQGFPKGTVIRIFDWRYMISKIEVKFI